ncbi:MAG: immunoglobulin domain-containing protein [Verrucomicrobiales bacterium]
MKKSALRGSAVADLRLAWQNASLHTRHLTSKNPLLGTLMKRLLPAWHLPAFLFTCMACAHSRADILQLIWSIKANTATEPGDRDWMTRQELSGTTFVKGDSVRGMASNPLTGNLVVVSGMANRALDPPLAVRVLDRSTGAELNTLDLTDVFGGTFRLDMVGVSEDGVVYAGNLVTSSNTAARNYKLYRWANDQPSTVPTVAFQGDPAGINELDGSSLNPQRWGDSMDVRGGGVDTQIVIAATTIANATFVPDPVCIFTTSDGQNFTPHLVSGVSASTGSLTVAFGEDILGYDDPSTPSTENVTLTTIYTKRTGQPMRRIGVRTDTWQAVASTLVTYPVTAFPNSLGIIGIHVPSKRLGAIDLVSGADNVRLYDMTNPQTPVQLDQEVLPVDNANGNSVGSADLFLPPAGQGSLRVYFLDTNNGLYAYELQPSTAPPEITTQPASYTVIEGGSTAFNVAASGAPAPSYQWIKGDTDIPGATSSTYTIPITALADAGTYQVRVTNTEGTATSTPATLTVLHRVSSDAMELCWKLAPGDRPYLSSTDGTQRGLAYSSELDHLILISRTPVAGLPNPAVIVLDAATGADVGPGGTPRTLKLANSVDPAHSVSGGTFLLNLAGCSDDGVIYAANLVTSGGETPNFKIYSWSNDSGEAEPVRVYGPGDIFKRDAADTGDRAGDSFDVRGSGAGTQMLVSARNQNKFAVLTTADGLTFTPTVFQVAAVPGTAEFAQAAFGEDTTIWTKGDSGPLRHISFDFGSGTAAVLQSFTSADFPAAARLVEVDPQTNQLGAIAIENPDNLRLYDISDLAQRPVLLDQEFFATDNPNTNIGGSVRFGGGRIYAVDANNGVMAMKIDLTPTILDVAGVRLDQSGGTETFSFDLSAKAGGVYRIQSAGATSGWTDVTTVTLTASPQRIQVTIPAGQLRRLFRAVPQ